MKKLIIVALVAFLSACQTTSDTTEIEQLKAEIKQLKHIQALVAQKVGLGELVRPDEISITNGQRVGEESANIVLLEFTDLHCPFCATYHKNVWPQIKADYVDTGKVLFVGKELPLPKLHPRAAYAAVTLRCAAKQGAYSDTKNYLFEKGQKFAESDLTEITTLNNLDVEVFEACLKDVSVHNAITSSLLDAKKLGFASTPTFIIGVRKGDAITDYEIVNGAGSVKSFTAIFDKLLAKNK
ncbi:thioredoxin domain-containing protein [Colwellia sp. UCD-KL20]|uniref:DsbA family protein n=1 Tax=Colwellia sp. UCD-KL20 TaxID=1917165 RepID=UPI000970B407|nr:thioredoxin domain-containing protein [Colwellia sp. UCD-KL20]